MFEKKKKPQKASNMYGKHIDTALIINNIIVIDEQLNVFSG